MLRNPHGKKGENKAAQWPSMCKDNNIDIEYAHRAVIETDQILLHLFTGII